MHGQLAQPSASLSDQTVGNILHRHGIPPAPVDLEEVYRCRRPHNRLGFAYQVGCVRLFNGSKSMGRLFLHQRHTQTVPYVMPVSLDESRPGPFAELVGSEEGRGDARFGLDERGRLSVVSRQTDAIYLTDLIAD